MNALVQSNAAASPVASQARPAPVPGPVRAAILLLALGEEKGGVIWQSLNQDEILQVSTIMAKLGPIPRDLLNSVAMEFIRGMSGEKLNGGPEPTEKILMGSLPRQRARAVIDDIKTPEAPTLWQRLERAKPETLATFLMRESPQTIALVLDRLNPEASARVVARFPATLASDIIDRMTRLDTVPDSVMKVIETMLEREFVTPPKKTSIRDPIEHVAAMFNALDKGMETRLLGALDNTNRDAAQKLRSLMFSFDDLGALDQTAVQTLLRSVERDTMVKALKGATRAMRDFFFAQMSQRAARGYLDDMEALGPVRLREVDDAQRAVVNLTKDLAAKGELTLPMGSDDEMVA
ncbi:MAG: flagellar motor switch protein FliG [Alphaproteobacteria bacterium]